MILFYLVIVVEFYLFLLLAPESGAHRRGAHRDFHLIPNPTIAFEHLSPYMGYIYAEHKWTLSDSRLAGWTNHILPLLKTSDKKVARHDNQETCADHKN